MQTLSWWEAKDGRELSDSLQAAISDCVQENTDRTRDLYTWLRLYDSRAAMLSAENVRDYVRQAPSAQRRDRLPGNMVRRVTNFAVNRVGKTFPGVEVQTTRTASWDDMQSARQLGRLVEGTFTQGKVYQVALVALLHGCVLGTGAVKVVEEEDRVSYEAVFPGELRIPLLEQLYGQPRTLYQHKFVDVAVLRAKFPKSRGQLELLKGFVETVEAWRLPSKPGAEDGRHVITTIQDAIVLFDEPWGADCFPFAWFKYDLEALGFWSTGLGNTLLPYQYDINVCLRTIRANVKAGGHLWIAAERGAQAAQHITDEIAGILEYTPGQQPPRYVVNPLVSPDLVNHLIWLIQQCWEETGFSQQAAASMKPAGLNSGKALLTYLDQQSERQALLGKSWERLFSDLTLLTIDAAQRIYERTGEFEATWEGRGEVAVVSMRDAMVDRSLYRVKVASTSRLPDTPSGRLQFVSELVAQGLITEPMTILRLLDIPDVASELSELTAPRDLIDSMIARIMRGETGIAPHERMPLALARDRANLAYCRAQVEGAPPAVLDALGTFADLANQQLQQAEAAQTLAAEQALAQQRATSGSSTPALRAPDAPPPPMPPDPTPTEMAA